MPKAKTIDATAPPTETTIKKKKKATKKRAVAAKPAAAKKKKRAKRRVAAAVNGTAGVSKAISRAESALKKETKRLATVKAQVRSLQKAIA